MSAIDDLSDGLSDEDLAKGLEKKKLSGKQLVFFGLPVLVLLVVGVTFWLLSGGEETASESHAASATTQEATEILFYDLPEILVNLNTNGRKASYLKIKVALELDRRSAITELDAKLPRVIDDFQIYLRELRLEDLNGSAGMFRLKEELLSRVNLSLQPIVVKDVLFKEMLVQ